MEKFECLDTTNSRVLFGYLRNVYNCSVLGERASANITETLEGDVKKTALFLLMKAKKTNTEIRLARKKRGNLPSYQQIKSTITVKDGLVKFKTLKGQKSYELTLKSPKDLRDGIYTEAYISWEQKTPFITLNRAKARFDRPGISEKNLKRYLKNKLIAEKTNFNVKKSQAIKIAKKTFDKFGENSSEFKIEKINLIKTIKSFEHKVKVNLYTYIEKINTKYCTLKIQGSLFAGENQAGNNNSIFTENSEKTVYDLIFDKSFSTDDQNFLNKIING